LIDSELNLLNLKIRYPEQFLETDTQAFQSSLYLVPNSKDLGFIGMAEIVVSLHLLEVIRDSGGKPATLIQIANIFERVFNFSFGSVYDLKDALFRRKPYNLTKTLDILRNAILRESKKRNE